MHFKEKKEMQILRKNFVVIIMSFLMICGSSMAVEAARVSFAEKTYTIKVGETVNLADELIADERSVSDRVEAEFIKAKSYMATSRRDEALALLEKLAADMSGKYGAEAAYMLILDSYDRGDFEKVEAKVYAFADAGSAQTYWLAKSFIVLGDSFMERDDVEQAKATFESVRDGYTPSEEGDDVLDNVKLRLDRIEEISKQQE
jgi:tetratricopeptide (TPR) repeat protein